ncbi:MAG: aminodeoxychorismate/anthranilate synthase component II [Verrucomicrobia bacterium]|nr:aminodeoxychorismate/anthranilate synthase component II [Verrucomicrobiota bacterium]MCH8512192.1 aminodeoxychorismate/anthranilate synthase component II [Kiritimatiellia bacterium]
MILVIDNYDSFTYNLVQYLGMLGAEIKVVRNDEVTLAEIEAMAPEKILVSPGPCSPAEAGISVETILRFGEKLPVFGVCLGHQSIGHAYGGKVVRADRLMHGKTSPIHHDGTGVFQNMPNPFNATRYHSLIVEKDSLPDCLRVNAWTEEGEIMGLVHKTLPVFGVQFHPESVLTDEGMTLMRNFVEK